MPFDDLAGRGLEDEPAEGEDRAVLLGQADELGRIDRAAGRVVPADERLDADDAAGARARRSAGSGRQVAAADALAEIRRSARAARRSSCASSGRRLDPALAVRLGPVHRDVRVAQQLVGRLVAAAAGADRRRCSRRSRRCPRIAERQLEGRDDPPGHRQRLGDGRALDGQERELVATKASDQVVRPELLADAVRRPRPAAGRRPHGRACR